MSTFLTAHLPPPKLPFVFLQPEIGRGLIHHIHAHTESGQRSALYWMLQLLKGLTGGRESEWYKNQRWIKNHMTSLTPDSQIRNIYKYWSESFTSVCCSCIRPVQTGSSRFHFMHYQIQYIIHNVALMNICWLWLTEMCIGILYPIIHALCHSCHSVLQIKSN